MRAGRLGAVAVVAATAGCGRDEPAVPVIEIARESFHDWVEAAGELTSESAVTVSAGRSRSPLTISWLAGEGSTVEAGELVVEFDSEKASEDLAKADAEVRKIEERMKKHAVEVAAKRADLAAEATRSRISRDKAEFKATLDSGLVPEQELLEARMDLRLAAMDLGRVERSLAAEAPKNEASLALLAIKLEKARNQMEMAQATLGATRVTAAERGVVVYKQTWKNGDRAKVAPGDTIWPGRPVVDLVDLDRLEFVAQVQEEDAVRIEPGQTAKVRLQALPERVLEGKVSKVAAVAEQADPRLPRKHVEVKIAVDPGGQELHAGLTGSAEIEVVAEEDVVAVPREAVYEDEGHYVFVSEKGAPVRRPVTLGAAGATAVIIAEGLAPGALVFARDPTRTPEEIEDERRRRQKEARSKRKDTKGGGRSFIRF